MGALRSDTGEPRRMEERSLYLWTDDDGNFDREIDDGTVAEDASVVMPLHRKLAVVPR